MAMIDDDDDDLATHGWIHMEIQDDWCSLEVAVVTCAAAAAADDDNINHDNNDSF